MYDLPAMGRLLTAEDFEPWIGRPFMVDAEPEPVAIHLMRVDRRAKSRFALRQPFHLVFASELDVLLVDGLYTLHSGRCGPHQIFLVPTLSPPDRRLYEAVFN